MAYLSAQQRRQRAIVTSLTAGLIAALGAVMILTRGAAVPVGSLASSWSSRASAAQRQQVGMNSTQQRLAVVDRMYSGYLSHTYLGSLSLLNPESVPPFTHDVQRWIYESQNPEPGTCSEQKYLLGYQTDKQGLGSTFHVAASFLGNALHHGYIFQWEPLKYDPDEWDQAYNKNGTTFYTGQEWVDEGCGRNESYTSFDCILVPLSTCDPRQHATKENSLRVYPWHPSPDPIPWDKNNCPEPWASRLRDYYAAQGVQVSREYLKYWWRAQAVAYIVRPNAVTMDAIRRLRLDPSLHRSYNSGEEQQGKPIPYPLPRGTISMHVRHGDKGREMKLVAFKDYVEAAEKLITENPLNYKRIGFISSEDQGVINDAGNLTRIDTGTGPDHGWVVYTSAIHRSNSGPMQQLAQFGSKTQLTIQWLSQLFLALECDVWLGTRNSNWNRLIDELRCTIVDKCHTHVFVELGQKHEWADYHWRKSQ